MRVRRECPQVGDDRSDNTIVECGQLHQVVREQLGRGYRQRYPRGLQLFAMSSNRCVQFTKLVIVHALLIAIGIAARESDLVRPVTAHTPANHTRSTVGGRVRGRFVRVFVASLRGVRGQFEGLRGQFDPCCTQFSWVRTAALACRALHVKSASVLPLSGERVPRAAGVESILATVLASRYTDAQALV